MNYVCTSGLCINNILNKENCYKFSDILFPDFQPEVSLYGRKCKSLDRSNTELVLSCSLGLVFYIKLDGFCQIYCSSVDKDSKNLEF